MKLTAKAFVKSATSQAEYVMTKLLGQVIFLPYASAIRVGTTMLSVFAKAIVCSDCESGNKSAFEALKERLETGTEDPELAFFVCFTRLSACW